MENEIDVGYNPTGLPSVEELSAGLEDQIKKEEDLKKAQAQSITSDEQYAAEQEDPRNADTWGIKGLAKEAQSILSGGLQDTASSIATFPERTIDALSGEMKREKEMLGEYKPEWQPFDSYDDPIITRTWWGKLLRGTVHFGSMAAGTVLAAKGLAIAGVPLLGAGAAKLLGLGSVTRAMAIGGMSDLISKESDGHNALGALTEKYGWIDTPLTTKETDHPIMMKLKNIVEGMGIGLVFDGVAHLIGKGGKSVKNQIIKRNQSIDNQTTTAALIQIRKGEAEFRAAKNAPISQRHQGADISEVDAGDAYQQLKRTRTDWGSEDGSTGSVTTAVERERIALEGGTTDEVVERTLRGLFSDDKFKKELDAVKGNRKELAQVWRDAVHNYRQIVEGRNAADMPAEEYLSGLFEKQKAILPLGDEVFETWAAETVVTADLVVGSLLKQLRDTGIAGREIADYVSLDDIDGPAKQIVDTMLTALTQTKKSRFVASDYFRSFGAGKTLDQINRAVNDSVAAEMVDTKESIMSILKIAKDDADDELLNALFEAFSMMKNVNSLDDFDNWARTILKGGQIGEQGPQRTGALIRSLQEMISHSVLSGPKTPLRALLGTGSATFLRPISTFIGATMRYPFTGDAATIRGSLASMNGMLEAIPEAFDLFFTKLNGYWSGDISTVKTRFIEFTKGDYNWEVMRRWAEDSGRATRADRAIFAMTNMIRGINNNNLFTYSTKIMAATDDAFTFLLGRAKMREKAMRRVLELEGNGVQLPEITANVMKAYQDDFYGQVFDSNGNIKDEATMFAKKEVTLTQDLTGFAKGLNDVMTANPFVRPFFLFARTGVNGLALTGKHTPGFNFLVKEFNDIAFANPENLASVKKYGINTLEELHNAKSLQTGRLAIGSAVVFMGVNAWMSGRLAGNGPTDRQMRQGWIDGGYLPRTIEVGGVRVEYDSIEPFGLILSTIADVGDASILMGEEWTEKELQKISLVIAQSITGKSYLAGLQQLVDLTAGRPGQVERIIGSITNNTVPLAALRNEMGKLITPYMREINSGVFQSWRNRNLASENLPGVEGLPVKYDMLNGKPLKNWDFMTRAFNMVSPIQLNLDQSPGRQFLFESGYDLRLTTFYAPDGTNLTDDPRIRSLFQEAIGKYDLEKTLNDLAQDPKIIASMRLMQADIRAGNRARFNARDYYHNIVIDRIFKQVRELAWDDIKLSAEVLPVVQLQESKSREQAIKQFQSYNLNNMYK
mgnify:FL=1|tara:strand:- start:2537 stop:6253 length:3717 start_codon:yes stop_codon:yes gene_type:complete